MTSSASVNVSGLREVLAGFAQLEHADDQLQAALPKAGQLLVHDAQTLAPKATGAMAKTIRATITKGALTVSADVPAYTFHAIALKKSKGGMTFRVKAGPHGKAYVRKARIRNRPFLIQAAQRKQADVVKVLSTALGDAIRKAAP